MPRLKLSLLGPFQVYLDGKPITTFESNKVIALLAYLAAEAGRPLRREFLADLIWPGWPRSSAMRNLSSALADLRKNIADRDAQPAFLLISRDSLQLNREADVWVDAREFEAALEEQRSGAWELGSAIGDQQSVINNLQSAIALYRGPFLEGFSLPDSAAFEEWLTVTREKVNRQVLQTVGKLSDAYEKKGEYEPALLYARRQVELEPWLEEAHQRVMRLLALNGQRSAALAQFEKCRKALKDELSVEPGVATVRLYESIRDEKLIPSGEKEPSPSTHLPPPPGLPLPAEHAQPRVKHNLPQPVTRFFGREDEIAAVKERLGVERIVTLTGSGGVGKTRLALRLAEETQEDFRDGVWFVGLAPLMNPQLVPQEVTTSLGLHEEPGRSVQEILEAFVRSRQLLLVLDNCEHLLEACAHLADSLLHASLALKILATSREPLGVAGEALFRVPSLPFPEVSLPLSAESMDAYASIRLFVDRARLVVPGYQVTVQNAPALASICQRLDGIPLAIELAAARITLLTAEQIADRLKDVFRLLTGGSRTALPRQQTLRATVDWSYVLLNEKERLLLRRLAVFAGGWYLAGVEAVCAGEEIDKNEVLDLLGNLVNKSLVIADRRQGSPTRYRMLDTIQGYAHEKLVDAGEGITSRQRHLAYFMELAETSEARLHGYEQMKWFNQLEVEIENIRLALAVGLVQDPQAGLRLCSALHWFWVKKDHRVEGRRWMEEYLRKPENAIRNATRGRALARTVEIAWLEPVDESLGQESLEISREIQDIQGQGEAHMIMGFTALWKHADYQTALFHLETAQTIFEQLQDHWRMAVCFFQLGNLAVYQGDVGRLLAYCEKNLALQRETGDWFSIVISLENLGEMISHYQGDLRRGQALLEEALAISRQNELEIVDLLNSLGDIFSWQGEYQRATQTLEETLELSRNSRDESQILVAYLFVGSRICWQGRLEEGIAMMEQGLKTLKESSSLSWIVAYQQSLLLELAYAWGCLGELDRAKALVEENLPMFQEDFYQPRLKKLLGFLALCKGEFQEAVGHYRESLRFAQKLGNRLETILPLESYAWVLGLSGQHTASARLLAAAEAFRAQIGAVIFPRDLPMHEQVISALKAGLGEAAYASAWVQGQALGFDQAVADALS